MNRKIAGCLIWGTFFISLPLTLAAQAQSIKDFLLRLENDLQSKKFASYLDAFSPALREKQKEDLSFYFDKMKMESVKFHWANKGNIPNEEPIVFLQVIIENPYSALIEMWQLKLAPAQGSWIITEKDVRGNLSQLFKINIPAERAERAALVEIAHADITLLFKDALVFYDNIPGLETALLVIGDGRVSFTPSDENEQHQLELIFKSRRLDDRVDYAFLRFSMSFFERNIKITRKTQDQGMPVSEVDRKRASSLFREHRLHYFTVESPLSTEPLSFLPQGEEAVFEINARKAGDLAYIYSSFAEEEITLYDRLKERFLNLYSPPSEKGKKRMVITFSQKYDVENLDIELSYEPSNFYMSAKARIDMTARLGPLDSVKFRFHPGLEILRIYDDKKRELFFTRDKAAEMLYVYFVEPVDKDENAVIDVYYRGVLKPPPQLTDTVTSAQFNDSVILIPPQYDTYLISHSARWYPSPSDDDYFTARLKIIVPPEYGCLSNGLLQEQGRLNGIQRVTEIDKLGSVYSVFETKTPVKYLTFLVGKLSLVEQAKDSPPLFSYVSSDLRFPRKNILEEVGKILEFYESRFGPFPFQSLSIVQRLWMSGGGHSPASFIVLNDIPRTSQRETSADRVYDLSSPVDLTEWKEYFLAHEIAHQWWGQGVTWARYRDQWLSEGLAQFASILYIRSKHNHRAFSNILKKLAKWTEQKSAFGPITLGSRLSFLDFQAYQAIIYNKSALVLNMLLDLLGEDVFFTGLKEFQREYKYSAASTGQFRRVMERVAGRDLDQFFSLWFNSHLLPESRVSYTTIRKQESFVLKLRVDQAGDIFSFPLWVEWEEKGNARRHREKVIIDKKSQEFEFPLQDRVTKVVLNPDRAVPGRFTTHRG